ncbi:MAG TPA: acyl carrier protein [Streptosporangiaceae bacterium]
MPDTSTDAIRTWLTERVASYLERSAGEISADALFVEIGIDSMYLLTICGDIEDEFGYYLEPTILMDYPTITAVAGYLSKELNTQGSGVASD